MKDDSEKNCDSAIIRLDHDEALVLFELLARWAQPETVNAPAAACSESIAEIAVLLHLLADLERQLVAPFKANYLDILSDARSALQNRGDLVDPR